MKQKMRLLTAGIALLAAVGLITISPVFANPPPFPVPCYTGSVAGTWVLTKTDKGYALEQTSPLQNTFCQLTNTDVADFTMHVRMKMVADLGSDPYNTMNIVFRETSASSLYILSLRPQDGSGGLPGSIAFYRSNAGNGPFGQSYWNDWTTLAQVGYNFQYANGATPWIRVLLTVKGSSFSATVNIAGDKSTAVTLTANDDTYTKGAVGFMTNEADVYFRHTWINNGFGYCYKDAFYDS